MTTQETIEEASVVVTQRATREAAPDRVSQATIWDLVQYRNGSATWEGMAYLIGVTIDYHKGKTTMSMSTHVIGFKAPTPDFLAKLEAYEACRKAKIQIPAALEDYFEGERPNPLGQRVRIENSTKPYQDDNSSGYEIDLAKLPSGVTHLLFTNSW